MNVIETLNKEEEARLLEGGKVIPDFSAGDTLVVQFALPKGTAPVCRRSKAFALRAPVKA